MEASLGFVRSDRSGGRHHNFIKNGQAYLTIHTPNILRKTKAHNLRPVQRCAAATPPALLQDEDRRRCWPIPFSIAFGATSASITKCRAGLDRSLRAIVALSHRISASSTLRVNPPTIKPTKDAWWTHRLWDRTKAAARPCALANPGCLDTTGNLGDNFALPILHVLSRALSAISANCSKTLPESREGRY